MLLVGKCLKAHGIRGDVKVDSFMDSPKLFCKLKEVTIGSRSYKVEKLRPNSNFVLMKLEGVDTMNDAENFRNQEIFVERKDMPQINHDRVYIDDILGAKVYAKDDYLGILDEVLQNGCADVYLVKKENNMIMFPIVGDIIIDINTDEKIIVVDKEMLERVAVYED